MTHVTMSVKSGVRPCRAQRSNTFPAMVLSSAGDSCHNHHTLRRDSPVSPAGAPGTKKTSPCPRAAEDIELVTGKMFLLQPQSTSLCGGKPVPCLRHGESVPTRAHLCLSLAKTGHRHCTDFRQAV